MSSLFSSNVYEEKFSYHYFNYIYENKKLLIRRIRESVEPDDKKKLDLIPRALVASFKSDAFHQSLRDNGCSCYEAIKFGIRIACSDGQWGYSPRRLEKTDDLFSLQRKRKNILGRGCPPPTSLAAAAVRYLWRQSNLFHAKEDWIPQENVTAFFVQKSNQLYRIILDCRWANTFWDNSDGKFSLFGFETLLQVISNLSIHDNWSYLNLDLRHWFHQLKLANRFKRFFALRMTDQEESNTPEQERQRFYVYPNAHPMGWFMSPLVGQSTTWGLILHRRGGSFPASFGLPTDQELNRHSSPFPWLPLRGGGGIFVILDNILIVTPDDALRKRWFEHIVSNCNEFHAYLKCEARPVPEEDPVDSPINDAAALEKECCGTLYRGDKKTHFNFCGVDWYHGHQGVPLKKFGDNTECPDVNPQRPNYNIQTDVWTGTRRELASVLGRLQWYRRVHGIRFYHPDQAQTNAAICKAYAILTPPDGTEGGWDSSISLPTDVSIGLRLGWIQRASGRLAKAKPLGTTFKRVAWVAVDAATNESDATLPPQASYVTVDRDGAQPTAVYTESYGTKEEAKHISIGELHAVWMAVRDLAATHDVIILASDSTTVLHWLDNRDARADAALIYLQLIEQHLEIHNCRLQSAYVNTLDNLADTPTRLPSNSTLFDLEHHRLGPTITILQNAEVEARGTWSMSGAAIGSVTVRRERP